MTCQTYHVVSDGTETLAQCDRLTKGKTVAPTTSQREARGLRGRKGVDVWEQFVNLPRDKKRAYLIQQGVPAHRLSETLAELYSILWDENIRQSA